MGYQPAAYTIIQRGKLFYIKYLYIEHGPFRSFKKAQQEVIRLVESDNYTNNDIVIAQYNSQGERIK